MRPAVKLLSAFAVLAGVGGIASAQPVGPVPGFRPNPSATARLYPPSVRPPVYPGPVVPGPGIRRPDDWCGTPPVRRYDYEVYYRSSPYSGWRTAGIFDSRWEADRTAWRLESRGVQTRVVPVREPSIYY